MADFDINAGDTTPPLVADLADASGDPTNLAGAAVNLVLRNSDATVVYLNKACTVSGSTVTYTWVAGDTDVPGDYVAEFVVTFVDGTQQSFPTDGYFTVHVGPKLTGSSKPRPSYLTAADVILNTRRELDGDATSGRNKLANAVDEQAGTLNLLYDLGTAPTIRLSIGLETMWAWAANGRSLTVERGFDGTAPSQHAEDDVVLVGPEFTDARILRAVNDVLAALPSQNVYGTATVGVTIPDGQTVTDLAADCVSVLEVLAQTVSDWKTLGSFDVVRGVTPSGVGLRTVNVTGPLLVTYRRTFTPLTSLFDDVVAVTGIPASAVDLLWLGAAIRLMEGRPNGLVGNQAQPDPRQEQVKVGDVLNAPAGLRQRFSARLQDETTRLRRLYPYRLPTRRLMG